jgi:hypothetical protein
LLGGFPVSAGPASKLFAFRGPKKNPSGLILPVVTPRIAVFGANAGISADESDH